VSHDPRLVYDPAKPVACYWAHIPGVYIGYVKAIGLIARIP